MTNACDLQQAARQTLLALRSLESACRPFPLPLRQNIDLLRTSTESLLHSLEQEPPALREPASPPPVPSKPWIAPQTVVTRPLRRT